MEPSDKLPNSDQPKKRKPGRPKGSRKNPLSPKQQVKDMLTARDIIKYGVDGAYAKEHPNASEKSVVQNSWRIINKQVKENIKQFLAEEGIMEVTEENIKRLFTLIIQQYIDNDPRVKASDFRGVLDSLAKLFPAFSSKLDLNDVSAKSEAELDREIDELSKKLSGRRLYDEKNPPIN